MKRLRVMFLLALGVDAAILAFTVGKLPARGPLLLLGPAALLFLWGVAEAVRVIDPKDGRTEGRGSRERTLATFAAGTGVIAG